MHKPASTDQSKTSATCTGISETTSGAVNLSTCLNALTSPATTKSITTCRPPLLSRPAPKAADTLLVITSCAHSSQQLLQVPKHGCSVPRNSYCTHTSCTGVMHPMLSYKAVQLELCPLQPHTFFVGRSNCIHKDTPSGNKSLGIALRLTSDDTRTRLPLAGPGKPVLCCKPVDADVLVSMASGLSGWSFCGTSVGRRATRRPLGPAMHYVSQ